MAETVDSAPDLPRRLWLVTVDCWYMVPRRAEPKRVINSYVVEAPASEAAIDAGRNAAEDLAELGPKWIRFEVRGASSITLPFRVSR